MIYTYLTNIIDGLSEAVFLLDQRRFVLLSNRTAEQLFGGNFKGQDFVRVVRHPECLEAIDEVLSGKDDAKADVSLPGPISTNYQIRVVGLSAGAGFTARAAVIITDLSYLHDAEQMRSDFVANVSHELRSPLTALSGIIETLKGAAKDDPDARQFFLSVMEREALRMDRLIDDLLSLSKFEANRRVQPGGQVDVRKTIEEVVATLTIQADREAKTIELVGDDNSYFVRGENDELTQVFQNLIENAIKYGAPNTIVTITLARNVNVVGVAGKAVSIEVRDQGAGIEAIHIPRLTERFYRVDASRSREHGGTGLGLAIVKHIVNRHRGRLQISSQVGVGSSFVVSLPAFAVAP